MESREMCVLGLYRSAADTTLSNTLSRMIPEIGPVIVTGDFNICSARTPDHEVFQALRTMGFKPLISEATHFAGGHIDQAWLREGDMASTVQLYSPYYTCRDHDALLISMVDRRTEQGEYSKQCLAFSL
jgi:endonuclease/exonuclease/phosphatase (EEP) superfamily protein YafD